MCTGIRMAITKNRFKNSCRLGYSQGREQQLSSIQMIHRKPQRGSAGSSTVGGTQICKTQSWQERSRNVQKL